MKEAARIADMAKAQAVGEAIFDREVAASLVRQGKRPYRRRTSVAFHWVELDPTIVPGLTRIQESIRTLDIVVRVTDGTTLHVFVVPPAEFSALLSDLGEGRVVVPLGDTGTVVAQVDREGRPPLLVTTPDAIRMGF